MSVSIAESAETSSAACRSSMLPRARALDTSASALELRQRHRRAMFVVDSPITAARAAAANTGMEVIRARSRAVLSAAYFATARVAMTASTTLSGVRRSMRRDANRTC